MVQQFRSRASTIPTESVRLLRCARLLESRTHVMWSEAAVAVFAVIPKSTSSDGAHAGPSGNLQLGRYYSQLRF